MTEPGVEPELVPDELGAEEAAAAGVEVLGGLAAALVVDGFAAATMMGLALVAAAAGAAAVEGPP